MKNFTIVIPTFNRPRLLTRAVKSVLEQDFENYEVVVVNDHCDKINLNDALSNDKVKIIEANLQLGPAGSRNIGCHESNGKYITFLDDDDVMKSGFLRFLYEEIREADDIDAFYWSGVEIYESKDALYNNTGKIEFIKRNHCDPSGITDALAIGAGYGLTCKRSTILSLGCFDTKYKFVEDTELIIRLLNCGVRPIAIEGCFIEVNKHSSIQLTSEKNNEYRARECLELLTKNKQFFHRYPIARAQLENYAAYLENSWSA